MFESFFGLSRRPFAAAPAADCFFPAHAAENARQTLVRCVERAEGPGILSGPAGVGKSLLLRVLARHFKDQYAVALLDDGRISNRRELLQAIAFQFGLPYRGLEEGELRLSLIDYLTAPERPGGMLMLVDEAHTLPWRVLEEMRLLSNLVRNGQPRVRTILAGSTALEERFASPRLEAFSQRLAARTYLEPMHRDETIEYVRFQVREAGGIVEEIFTPAALDMAYRASDGIPRLVNQVCDHALVLAYAGGIRRIDAPGIEEAWADLQQLPTPWVAPRQLAVHSIHREPVIEFGELDDDMEEPIEPMPTAIISGLDADAPAPVERLDEVQEHIQSITDEYQPSAEPVMATPEPQPEPTPAVVDEAPREPEPEASFEQAPAVAIEPAPFDEQFEEEEVVLERFSAPDSSFLGGQKRVHSQEGSQLSAMLDSYAARDENAAPRFSVAAPPAEMSQTDDAEVEQLSAEVGSISELIGLNPAPCVAADSLDGADSQSISDDAASSEEVAASCIALRPESSYAEDDDAQMDYERGDGESVMIVEDDPQATHSTSRAPHAARPQEYGQLFARLRRG